MTEQPDEALFQPLTRGLHAVHEERSRQKLKYPDGHDDEHGDGEIAHAAMDLLCSYLNEGYSERVTIRSGGVVLPDPWDLAKKNQDPRRRLAIAGALIGAEIDRLDRAARRAT